MSEMHEHMETFVEHNNRSANTTIARQTEHQARVSHKHSTRRVEFTSNPHHLSCNDLFEWELGDLCGRRTGPNFQKNRALTDLSCYKGPGQNSSQTYGGQIDHRCPVFFALVNLMTVPGWTYSQVANHALYIQETERRIGNPFSVTGDSSICQSDQTSLLMTWVVVRNKGEFGTRLRTAEENTNFEQGSMVVLIAEYSGGTCSIFLPYSY